MRRSVPGQGQLVDYLRLLSVIRQTVTAEAPVVRNAIAWSAKAFAPRARPRAASNVSAP